MERYLIINNANLPYKVIGRVIDNYKIDSTPDTLYVGKLDLIAISYKDKKYSISVRYLKQYVEFKFDAMEDKNGKLESSSNKRS